MTIGSALSKAAQGLNMASKGTDIIASNITNAQTEGYVRRDINPSERVANGQGIGLNRVTVQRNASPQAITTVRRAQENFQQQKIISESLEEIVQTIGDVNSEYSLSARVDNFISSMKGLAETSENGALQDETINNAKLLATTINEVSTKIQEIRTKADSEIHRHVTRANELIQNLKQTSGDIISLGQGAETSALQDEQDRILDELSTILPIQTTYNENGSVRVATQTGATLLDLSAIEIEFTPSLELSPNQIYAYAGEAPGTPFQDTLSGLVIGGIDVTSSADKIQSMQGGKLGGLFKVRDEEMVIFQRQVDHIASRMIEIFRNNDSSLTDLNGNGTTDGIPDGIVDGDSLFTSEVAGTIFTSADDMLGIANSFKVNSAFDPDVGGDKRRIRVGAEATDFGAEGNSPIIRNWIDATNDVLQFDSNTDLTAEQSITSAIREFVSLASLRNQNEKNIFEFETGKINTLIDQRDNLHGVNIDSEMNDLVFLQRLYSANAILLQRAGDMLQTILDLR